MASAIPSLLRPPQRPPAMAAETAASSSVAAAPLRGGLSPAAVNSILLELVVERLGFLLKNGVPPKGFFRLCFLVARGIDYALANNYVPAMAHLLPSLVKEVYKHRNNSFLQSAIMVLMISVKNACQKGWFQIQDANELLRMTNELYSSFFSTTSISVETSNALDTISKVMSRFFPRLKLCHVIVSLEAKPGYDILMADFQIEKNISPGERIRLFVAQTDNLEISSCIISPPQVSFLVNGNGVKGRTNVSLDHGPQFPTDITQMLKFGTNIMQAVGYFSGCCIIAIAYVSNITSSIDPMLEDFVQPVISALDSDSEIIEGPSRVSLNCPISLMRIKTPVKGHLCKHHQCFDYDNFVEVNSSKPSWHCPCCNQPASYIDLRIDQNQVKILSETGGDTADVVIFSDGSWKAIADHNGNTNQLCDGTIVVKEDGNFKSESNRFSNTLTNVVDLTMEDNGECNILNSLVNWVGEIKDTKPFKDVPLSPVCESFSASSLASCTAVTPQTTTDQTGNDTWIRNWSSTSMSNGSIISTILPDSRIDGTLASVVPNFMPVITDAVSPEPNRELAASHELFQPTFQSISQENMLTQESQFGNLNVGTVAEWPLIPPRTVNRAPISVQAQPIQAQVTSSTQKTQTNVLPPNITPCSNPSAALSSIPSVRVVSDGFNTGSSDFQVQQVMRILGAGVPAQELHSMRQIQDRQEHQTILNPASQQVVGLSAHNQVGMRTSVDRHRRLGAYEAQLQPLPVIQNSHRHLPSLRTHQSMNHCANILPQSSCVLSMQDWRASQNVMSSGNLLNEGNQFLAAHHAMPHRGMVLPCASRTGSSFQVSDGFRQANNEQLQNMSVRQQAVTGSDSFPESSSELNWRSTGRMRGSLTGEAYSAALRHYMAQPNQQVPARPSTASTDPSSGSVHGSLVQQANWRHGN